MTWFPARPIKNSGNPLNWLVGIPFLLLAALFAAQGGKDARLLALAVAVSAGAVAFSLRVKPLEESARPLFLQSTVGFLVWQAVSMVFSPAPLAGWRALAGASLFVSSTALVGRHGRDQHREVWRLFVQGGTVLLALVWGAGGGLLLAGNPQYASFWAVVNLFLSLPVARESRTSRLQRGTGIAGAVASLFLLWSLPVRAGWVAAVAGALLWAGRRGGRRGVGGGLLLATLAIALAPARILKADDATAFKRLDIWRAAWRGIIQKPLAGWGPGQFESLYARHALPQESEPVRYDRTTAFAHNDGLQVLAETGCPGGVFVVLSLWGLWRAGRKGNRDGESAALAAGAVFSAFNFPLASPINAVLAGGTAGFLWPADTKEGARFPASAVRKAGAGLGIAATLWAGVNFVLAADSLRADRGAVVLGATDARWIDVQADRMDQLLHSGAAGAVDTVEANLRNLLRVAPHRADLWRSLGHLESDHRPQRAGPAEAAYGEALARKPHHAPWWLERAMIAIHRNDAPGAEESLHRALRAEPRYFNAALALGQWRRLKGDPAGAARWLAALRVRGVNGPKDVRGASGYQRAVLSRDERGLARALALCYIDLGRFREALVELDKTEMDTPETWALRALALSRAGRPGDARAALRRGRSLAPEDPRWEILMKKIAEPNRP